VKRLLLAGVLLAGCGSEPTAEQTAPILSESDLARLRRLGPLGDPPPSPTNRFADDPAAQRLGQALFFDGRMSSDGMVSCASCHLPHHGFADPEALSHGAHGRLGTRHASTLVNVAWNAFQFWDGRADSLWAQPIQAIENPVEGNFTRAELAHFVARVWRADYEAIFGPLPDLSGVPVRAKPGDEAWAAMNEADRHAVDRIAANVGKALEAYVRQIVSRNSPLDRFLAGDESALGEAELRGAKVFVAEDRGRCIVCHDGPNLTDGGFHNIGIPDETGDTGRWAAVPVLLADPLNGDGPHSDAPGGRLEGVEQMEWQVGAYKTPTLRDVTLRPPYGHTGAFATLEAFIDFHDEGGGAPGTFAGEKEGTIRPIGLTAQEKADLLAFLAALEGEPLDRALIGPPR
jgi:cytochrome c peroxidase